MMPALTKKRSVSWPTLSALPAIDLAGLLQQPTTSRSRSASRSPMPSRSSQCCAQGGSASCRSLSTRRGIDLAALHLLDEIVPSRTSEPTISVTGMMAMTMQTSTLSDRREVAAAAEPALEGALQRLEDDGEDHRPEDRAVERQQQPEEGHRHQREQQQEGLVLELGLHRPAPLRRAVRLAAKPAGKRRGQLIRRLRREQPRARA